jgi:hypothetical protein
VGLAGPATTQRGTITLSRRRLPLGGMVTANVDHRLELVVRKVFA